MNTKPPKLALTFFVALGVLLCGPLQAGLIDSLVGTWKGTSTWRYGKQKQVATGTISIKKLGKGGLIVRSSGRVKGIGKFSEVSRYFASGESEGVSLINGETVSQSVGTWSVRRNSILMYDEIWHVDGDYTANGRVTLLNKRTISSVTSASGGARTTGTFRKQGK